jgi:membrane protein DedA with SNARE-associated domain
VHPLLASVTDSLFELAKHVVRDLGLPGIFLMIAADATGLPIAAAATMLFAGVNVSEGHHTLLTITIAGTLGDLAGASLAYAIGYFGRIELLEKHGRKLHVTPRKLELAERWFDRYGAPVILVGRVIPVVRTFISFPAGAARMPYPRFAFFTVLGGIILSLGFGAIGDALGANYNSFRHALGYVDYAIVLLAIAAIAALIVRRRRAADAPVG